MPLTSDQYSNDEFTINPGVLLPYLRAVNGLFTTYYYLLRRDDVLQVLFERKCVEH